MRHFEASSQQGFRTRISKAWVSSFTRLQKPVKQLTIESIALFLSNPTNPHPDLRDHELEHKLLLKRYGQFRSFWVGEIGNRVIYQINEEQSWIGLVLTGDHNEVYLKFNRLRGIRYRSGNPFV